MIEKIRALSFQLWTALNLDINGPEVERKEYEVYKGMAEAFQKVSRTERLIKLLFMIMRLLRILECYFRNSNRLKSHSLYLRNYLSLLFLQLLCRLKCMIA